MSGKSTTEHQNTVYYCCSCSCCWILFNWPSFPDLIHIRLDLQGIWDCGSNICCCCVFITVYAISKCYCCWVIFSRSPTEYHSATVAFTVRNPMKMSDIGFLKAKLNRPQNSKTEDSVSVVQFSKTDFGSLGTVFHVVSFTIHLAAW